MNITIKAHTDRVLIPDKIDRKYGVKVRYLPQRTYYKKTFYSLPHKVVIDESKHCYHTEEKTSLGLFRVWVKVERKSEDGFDRAYKIHNERYDAWRLKYAKLMDEMNQTA